MGFIVVQIDGMGTANRSKAFHDVCWKNLGDAGFPDRISGSRRLAAKYPYLDLNRVGIYGNSAGGQNAAGALLFHPEFYKVGGVDLRLPRQPHGQVVVERAVDGLPGRPAVRRAVQHDQRPQTAGQAALDRRRNRHTMYRSGIDACRLANALIKAGKDFELLVVPGVDHSAWAGLTANGGCRDFFVRHLLGVEPPDWNRLITPLAADKRHADEQNGAHSLEQRPCYEPDIRQLEQTDRQGLLA